MASELSSVARSVRSVRKLYKAILRLGRQWPAPESRKDRSLWEAIPRVAKQQFNLHRGNLSAQQIKSYGEAGVKELEALRNLRDNMHLKQVRVHVTHCEFLHYESSKMKVICF